MTVKNNYSQTFSTTWYEDYYNNEIKNKMFNYIIAV